MVIFYKIVKAMEAIYFLVYGCIILIGGSVAHIDIFLLWIFTTLTFWTEMAFRANTQN